MPSKYETPHTAREREIIAKASQWVAYQFRGRFARHVRYCTSLEAARIEAAALAKEGRRPTIIYAVAGAQQAYYETIQP